MDRRSFVGSLVAGIGASAATEGAASTAPAPAVASANAQWTLLQVSIIAAFRWPRHKHRFLQMLPGDRLHLVREHDDPRTPHAVRIEWREIKIGYVPRMAAQAAANLLDAGHTLHAALGEPDETKTAPGEQLVVIHLAMGPVEGLPPAGMA